MSLALSSPPDVPTRTGPNVEVKQDAKRRVIDERVLRRLKKAVPKDKDDIETIGGRG